MNQKERGAGYRESNERKDGELTSPIATCEVSHSSAHPQAKDKYTWTPDQEARRPGEGRISFTARSWNKHDIMAHPWSLAAHCDQRRTSAAPPETAPGFPEWVPFPTLSCPIAHNPALRPIPFSMQGED